MIRKRMMLSRVLAAAITVTMLFTSMPVKAATTMANGDKVEQQQHTSKKTDVSGQKFESSDASKSSPIDFAPSIKREKKEEGPHIQENELKKASENDIKEVHDPEEKVKIIVELEKDSLIDAGYSA